MKADRFPGPRVGPGARDELLAIWDALDPQRRKAVLFVARMMAKDAGARRPSDD